MDQGASYLPISHFFLGASKSSSENPRTWIIFLPLLTHKELEHFQREFKRAQIVLLFPLVRSERIGYHLGMESTFSQSDPGFCIYSNGIIYIHILGMPELRRSVQHPLHPLNQLSSYLCSSQAQLPQHERLKFLLRTAQDLIVKTIPLPGG